jgi:hypothetical protein
MLLASFNALVLSGYLATPCLLRLVPLSICLSRRLHA